MRLRLPGWKPRTALAVALLLSIAPWGGARAATGGTGGLSGSVSPAAGGERDLLAPAAGWTASASEQVLARAHVDPQTGGACLDYDFGSVSGFATLRRALPVAFPANHELLLRIHGEAPANELHLKFADESGDNVWWHRYPEFAPSKRGAELRLRRREIEFAWGPAQDHALRSTASIELTVARAKGGGHGTVCIDALSLRALAPELPIAPVVKGLEADLGHSHEVGGVVLHWERDAAPFDYDLEASGDHRHWSVARRVSGARGTVHWLQTPGLDARWLRVRFPAAGGEAPDVDAVRLLRFEVRGPEFGVDGNALFRAIGAASPRGRWPRGFQGEQSYWTLVGTPAPTGGAAPALVSEDGAVEIGRGGFSVEPWLELAGRWRGWADVQATQSLPEGYLPMPEVHWKTAEGVDLDLRAFAQGEGPAARLVLRYRLTNHGSAPQTLRFALAVRPLQVNPPTQFLTVAGGVHPIHELRREAGAVVIDGVRALASVQAPSEFLASTFDGGSIVDRLVEDRMRGTMDEVRDPVGYASGALLYPMRLAPGEERSIDILAPLAPGARGAPGASDAALAAAPAAAGIDALERGTAAMWRALLGRVQISLPPEGQRIADSVRSALAHILVSRDGAALQPGTRSYARSWIRDGAMMNEALLRLGHEDEAAAFLRWFAPFQYENGKVPCCADFRGSDPVPENDSHGEFLFAAAQLLRHTGDREAALALWPGVGKAVDYLDALRAQERTAAVRERAPELFGLLPASISHEGYMAKPMHSYWDDLWALRGLDDAVYLATALGKDDARAGFASVRDEFRADLAASVRETALRRGIDFVPGAAELGDFDATSTAIALAPLDEGDVLPQDLLRATFERYWRFCLAREQPGATWKDYTPYEVRTIAALVRLGERERAHHLLDFFFRDQRPAGWNQWAEVVGRLPREPRFIGDMPHAWVASDFVRSALDLFAFDRADGSVVLAAGIPDRWLAGGGVSFTGLRTVGGRLSFSLRRAGDGSLRLELRERPGKAPLAFSWPLGHAEPLWIDGRRIEHPEALTTDAPSGPELRISAGQAGLPAVAAPQGAAKAGAARRVLERLLGLRAADFRLEINPAAGPGHEAAAGERDAFEVFAQGGIVHVSGTSAIALARGAYDYLRNDCHCMLAWSGANLNLPARLPDAPRRRVESPFALRQMFNVCTFGYTTVWWDWPRWERELDWMALHGINMALAMVGQEQVWREVWNSFGLSDQALEGYFAGPAFLPWQRMGNINRHGGPLDPRWMHAQETLQKRILARMRELGIEPVVPAFSGFVPPQLRELQPGARLIVNSQWGGFGPEYRSVVLAPDSPLFVEIGGRFVQEYRRHYGDFRYWLADTFNELQAPVSAEHRHDELASFGRTVFASIRAGDPLATWVMQGWMFESDKDFWDPDSVRALLRDVPDDGMLILDLSNERFHGWKRHEAFFGKPWIYSIIHNFGGNNPMNGDLPFAAADPAATLRDARRGRLAGFGLAPEGIENNEVEYELLTDAAWSREPIDVRDWLRGYAKARYGVDDPDAARAWELLLDPVFSRSRMNVRHALQMRPAPGVQSDIGATPGQRAAIEEAAGLLLRAAPRLRSNPLYRNDLVELTAHVLAIRVDALLLEGLRADAEGRPTRRDELGTRAIASMAELDTLLSERADLRLERWIDAARRAAPSPAQRNDFERNARAQVTVWGSTELFDYAAKLWGGLVRDFYLPRWEMYFQLLREGVAPAQASARIAAWEEDWTRRTILSAPRGDTSGDVERLCQAVLAQGTSAR